MTPPNRNDPAFPADAPHLDQSAAERLRRLESVTDVALAHLDTDKLLDELLARVRDVVSADTATVLLLDPTGTQLVATAAVGIEEEVRQGVRVTVGRGFAGRIAQEREPRTVDHVDETTVVNPLLWERGLRALLGVPLLAGGRLIGVLHVGSVTPRRFSPGDVQLLRLVGDRIALAVDAQTSVTERAVVQALQRSLIPAAPPQLTGLEFAARYVPGAETGVGGDWYDVFPLPGDRVGIVIGDVVGHGLAAAVVMGRLRSALRAYALDNPDPSVVLRKLDHKAIHFETGTMATVAYAVVEPKRDRARLALAGHPPPILATPGGASVLLKLAPGPPIGAATGRWRYPAHVLTLPAGAVLCFYTDGLVERRNTTIDEGLERLRATVTAAPSEVVCVRVMAELVGRQTADDDIALLVVRRT